MITGSWVAQAVGAVARPGVADHLAAGPKTAAELAKAVGASIEHLAPTMRALAGIGLFLADARQLALEPISDCLRTDAPGSMRYLAIAETDHAHWATWGRRRSRENRRAAGDLGPRLHALGLLRQAP